MLFHVTLTHDAAHCPGYHPELMPVWVEGFEKRDELAQRFGVKVRSILNGTPDHVVYVIGEADRPMQWPCSSVNSCPPSRRISA